jgi:hypothetical protein
MCTENPDITNSNKRCHASFYDFDIWFWDYFDEVVFFAFILIYNKCCLRASVDTEMCCPKGKCGCQYFILLTLKKKNHGHSGHGSFLNKKLIMDYHFCLKSGPVFLFQICIIAPSPSQGIYKCIINNKLINNKFRFSI